MLSNKKHFPKSDSYLTLFFLFICFLYPTSPACANFHAPQSNEPTAWLKKQPVEFLENKGQMRDLNGNDASYLLFKAEVPGLDIYITEKGLSYVFYNIEENEEEEEREKRTNGILRANKFENDKVKLTYERLDMELSGAQIIKSNILMEDSGMAYYNYLSSSGTFYHVKKYRKITIKEVYPGIDWVLYSSLGAGLKYDFIVHPTANPAQIELIYHTKKRLELDKDGNLLIKSGKNSLKENSPMSYLLASGEKVESAFNLISNEKRSGVYEAHLGFNIDSKYDSMQTLVIDPQLVWATFYGGGAADGSICLKSDTQGNIYATGYSGGFNYPLLNAGTYFQSTPGNAFLLKFSNLGVLLWATYFVDSGTLAGFLTTDSNDNLYLCGSTISTNFPLVNAGGFFQSSNAGSTDAFVTKFNSAGLITWSTFYGGTNNDDAVGITVDQNNNVFMVGTTKSNNFPVQNVGTYYEGVMTGTVSGFIVKFDNAGNRLWASYLKGIDEPALTTDRFGSLYISGATFGNVQIPLLNPGGGAYYQPVTGGGTVDAFILKFSNSGVLRWGTRYGGSLIDWAYSIVADKSGNTFIAGSTTSTNFPVLNGGGYYQSNKAGQDDLFFLKFDSTGVRLWGSYFGGTRADVLSNNDHLALDDCGNLYFGCNTSSRNIPLMASCDAGFYDTGMDTTTFAGPGGFDLFIGRFANNTAQQWGTYLGGDGTDFRNSLDIDRYGNLFMTGEWISPVVAATYPSAIPTSSSYSSPPVAGDDHYFVKFKTAMPSVNSQTFSYSGPYCTNNNSGYLPATGTGFQTGGTFTAGAGLTINPATGQITPSTSLPGMYTVNYNVVACECVASQAIVAGTTTVSIFAAPVLSVTNNFTICSGKQFTLVANGATTYSWNTGSNSSSLTVVAPNNIGLVNYTVTGQTNSCSNLKVISVQVSKCTGLGELTQTGSHLKIYPNPNKGDFTIDADSDQSLILVNEAGQVIRELNLNATNKHSITIHGLSKGVYFISGTQDLTGKSLKLVVSD